MIFLGKAESSARLSARAEHRLLRVLTRAFEHRRSMTTTLDKTRHHAAR